MPCNELNNNSWSLKIIYSECYLVLGIGVLYILGLIFLPILMCWSPYFPWIWGKYPIPSYLQIRRLFIWIVPRSKGHWKSIIWGQKEKQKGQKCTKPIKKSQCWSCTFSSITKYPFNIKEKQVLMYQVFPRINCISELIVLMN